MRTAPKRWSTRICNFSAKFLLSAQAFSHSVAFLFGEVLLDYAPRGWTTSMVLAEENRTGPLSLRPHESSSTSPTLYAKRANHGTLKTPDAYSFQ